MRIAPIAPNRKLVNPSQNANRCREPAILFDNPACSASIKAAGKFMTNIGTQIDSELTEMMNANVAYTASARAVPDNPYKNLNR